MDRMPTAEGYHAHARPLQSQLTSKSTYGGRNGHVLPPASHSVIPVAQMASTISPAQYVHAFRQSEAIGACRRKPHRATQVC
jgi:hypothetical protein